MSEPIFTRQVSIGNLVQGLILIVTIVAGWVTLNAQVTNNGHEILALAKTDEQFEARMRTVEFATTRADERLTNILSLLSRIDARLENMERDRTKGFPQ